MAVNVLNDCLSFNVLPINDRLGFLKVVSADTETRRGGNQGVIWNTQCSARVLVDKWRDFRSV